jgi:hypothetical protein
MLHLPQQRRKRRRHKDDMQQAKPRETLAGLALLCAVSVLFLLGAVALMPSQRTERGIYHQGTKTQSRVRPELPVYTWRYWRPCDSIPVLWPEVVSTAHGPRCMVDEVTVRASRPDRPADVSAHLSGINK